MPWDIFTVGSDPINTQMIIIWAFITFSASLVMGLLCTGFARMGKGIGLIGPVFISLCAYWIDAAWNGAVVWYGLPTYDYWTGAWSFAWPMVVILLVVALVYYLLGGSMWYWWSDDGQRAQGDAAGTWAGRFGGSFLWFVVLIIIGAQSLIGLVGQPPYNNASDYQGNQNTWPQCDQSTQMAHLLHVTNASPADFLSKNSDVDHALVVAPDTVSSNNLVSIGTIQNLSTYLQPMSPYLVRVKVGTNTNGSDAFHYYWITGFQEPNSPDGNQWYGQANQAFKDHHKVSPGFLVEDAQTTNASDSVKLGYKIILVPNAYGSNGESDPARWLYFHWLMQPGHEQYVIDFGSLTEGLELDMSANPPVPYYTTTYGYHILGTTVNGVSGVLTLNALNGQVTAYPFDSNGMPYVDHNIYDDNGNLLQKANADQSHPALPLWVQHPYSKGFIDQRVTWWGYWNTYCSQAGHGLSDRYHYVGSSQVVTAKGLMYQYDFTSLGPDKSLSFLLFVSPVTGQAWKVTGINAPTSDVVNSYMTAASNYLSPGHVSTTNCGILPIEGRYVEFCDIVAANTNNDGAALGYGFAVTDWAKSPDAYVVDSTLTGAYQKLVDQINQGGPPGLTQICTSGTTTQVTGNITYKSEYTDRTGSYTIFVLDTKGKYAGTVYRIVTNRTSLLMRVGDNVTITFTCLVKGSGYTDLQSVFDNAPGFPNLGP